MLKKYKWPLRIVMMFMCVIVFFVWNHVNNQNIDVTVYRVFSEKIDNPVRAVFLSDLHQYSFGEGNAKLLEEVNCMEPDLILIGGDMINDEEPNIEIVLSLCRELVKIAPVYYSMGNHENKVVYGMNLYKEDLEEAGIHEGDTEDFSELIKDNSLFAGLEECGVEILQNTSARIEVEGESIQIGGISTGIDAFWPYSGHFFTQFESDNEDDFKILISHFPSTISRYIHEDDDIDLALSGHTHGGIIRLPGIGGVIASDGVFFPEDDGGKTMMGNMTFIISRGLGNHGLIPRIFNRPELVVIDLF